MYTKYFWNPVTIFLPVKDKKGLNSNTKIHIFETGNKQKLNIIKANLHIQKKYARCNVSQQMCQTKECTKH